ncbi:hypothetical protein NCCP691_40400 [Noviherbaspirillum aridicola]|uniref:Uncharacterized protein n=1 Tax=Noviherbaspirillum aridicola TaxID=2849687 RepID=A0ABQ4QAD4_9BURK|nr:hypothetical protein NCCP691_40400 [Noviherbaspirillum aridicola]
MTDTDCGVSRSDMLMPVAVAAEPAVYEPDPSVFAGRPPPLTVTVGSTESAADGSADGVWA